MRLTFAELKEIWQKARRDEEDDTLDTDQRTIANNTLSLVMVYLNSRMCHFTNMTQVAALVAEWEKDLQQKV